MRPVHGDEIVAKVESLRPDRGFGVAFVEPVEEPRTLLRRIPIPWSHPATSRPGDIYRNHAAV